jgi:2-dehydropantoate 2-reductase
MSIVIVGAGATGGYFGALLAQAGRDVTFLVRERRAAALRERGLRVVGPGGTEIMTPKLATAASLAPVARPAGTVLLTVKAAGLEAAIDEFRPVVGPDTTIVPVLNGMAHMATLNAAFGAERVLGGAARVATQLDGNGDIVALSNLASLMIGAQDGQRTPAVERTRELLDNAGIDLVVSDDILTDMWAKWAFIASVGAATCLLGGTAGEIAAAGGQEVVQAIVAEAYQVAAASGHRVPDADAKRTSAALTEPGSSFDSSMYRDLRQGRVVEVDAILGDLVDRGRTSEVPTPLLEAATIALTIHNDKVTADAPH